MAGHVVLARVDDRGQALERRSRALAQQALYTLERDSLGLNRLRGIPKAFGARLRVPEEDRLRLEDREQRHYERREGVDARALICDRDHAGDETAYRVVRQD